MRTRIFSLLLFWLAGSILVFLPSAGYGQSLPETDEIVDTLPTRSNMLMAAAADGELMTPSPKASAFMKYGEYPVSLHTGLVDITIPIYTIERCGVTIPIEFKYHASGIKYDDVSMEVGLGWTLNAGGMITRSIRGARDGAYNSYARDVSEISICNSIPNASDGYPDIKAVENAISGNRFDPSEKKDGECDMYSYSLPNQSGSFFFPLFDTHVDEASRMADRGAGIFIPINGMKVVRGSIWPGAEMALRDTEGVTYTFQIKDNDVNERYQEYYLTEILSADGEDSVTFQYDVPPAPAKIIRPYINASLSITQDYYLSACRQFQVDNPVRESGGIYYQYMRPPRLKRIDFRGGHVEFEYAVKNNVQTWDLRTIKIFNNIQSTPLQTIALKKSDFSASNKEQRLDRVVFTDSQNQSYDYEFGYNGEPIDFQSNNTFKGVDYWGYFNGSTVAYQKRFTPKEFISGSYSSYGMDRNSSEYYMQKGILNKIVYPTKGYTTFTYEAHREKYPNGTIKLLGGLRIKNIRNYDADGSLAEKKWYEYDGEYFQAQPDSRDYMTYSKTLTTHMRPDSERPAIEFCHYTKTTTYLPFSKLNRLITGSTVVYDCVTEYTGNETEDTGKTVYIYEVFLNEEKYPYPSDGTYRPYFPDTYERTYDWKSGKLFSKKIYKKDGNNYVPIYSLANNYIDIGTLEYRNLRVSRYINFYYHRDSGSSINQPDVESNFCNSLYSNYRGQFEGKTPLDYYNYYTTTGLRALASSVETKDGVTEETRYEYNKYGFPKVIAQKRRSGDEIMTVNSYPFERTGESVYVEMTNRNIISPVIYQSTYEYKENMYNNFMSSVSTSHTNYNSPNRNLYTMSERRIYYIPQYGAQSQERYVRYKQYDKFGNPLHIIQEDNTNVVYLWSYNSLYPVIQVRNATYQQVETALGASTIQSLAANINPSSSTITNHVNRLKTALPNTLVSYSTYQTLVGVKSITDASGRTEYYEYDGFGRLLSIRDDKLKDVESYEYRYSNQQ